jgi:hypothetical protein
MPHFPVTPAPEFDGKTGNGFWADALARVFTNVHQDDVATQTFRSRLETLL